MTETPQTRLYLALPPAPSAVIEKLLERVIFELEPACVLLADDAGASDAARDSRLREVTAQRDVALLVANDAERALSIGADGVHLPPDAARYGMARERLGQRAIIGMGCIENRHDAMVLAELGADYVGFGAPSGSGLPDTRRQEALIAWWSEIFVVPSVAFDVETPEAARRLAELGADFVAVAPRLWLEEDAAARIGEIAAALRNARKTA